MLSINDLKPKTLIMVDGTPYQILEVKHLHMGRGGSSVQTRIKNLATDQVFSRNFKPSDSFAQAEIEKRILRFLYAHRGEYVFIDPKKPRLRFSQREDALGETVKWLKPDTDVEALFLKETLLAVNLQIKMDFKVIEAPAGIRGDTAQGGSKIVTIETGVKISTPLFVNEGDIIRVNTSSGEYVERVSKS